jgi:hypothetical protein
MKRWNKEGWDVRNAASDFPEVFKIEIWHFLLVMRTGEQVTLPVLPTIKSHSFGHR